jgi:D-alanyl-D-alanine carboxypeptidase
MMANRTLRQVITLGVIVGTMVFLSAPDLLGKEKGKLFDRKTQTKLESLVEHTMKETEVPGVIAGVWTPGGKWIRAKGLADLKTKREIRVTDLFRIGSTTKPFTATLILQLADEGKFRLDDTIDRFDFGIKIPDSDKMTIRHLLNHTSGLFDFDEDEKFFIPYIKNLTRKWTTKDLLEISLSHPRYGAPGEKHHYSNTNFVLLSLMIEQMTGNRLDKEMTPRIFKPLGLKNTYLPGGTGIKGMHTHGYMKTKDGKFLDTTSQDLSWKWAQGGIISDLEDLRIWTRALGKGKLISPAMYKESFKWVYPESKVNPLDQKYGLGIGVMGDWVGHTGGEPGYMNYSYYNPVEDSIIIVSFNKMSICDLTKESMELFNQEMLAYAKLFVDISKTVLPRTFPDVDTDQVFEKIKQLMKGKEDNSK